MRKNFAGAYGYTACSRLRSSYMNRVIECLIFLSALSCCGLPPPSKTRRSRTHHQSTSPSLLGFLHLPFFYACPLSHPAHHPLLPTPVINFSTSLLLFSLHFPFPFFPSSFLSSVSPISRYEKRDRFYCLFLTVRSKNHVAQYTPVLRLRPTRDYGSSWRSFLSKFGWLLIPCSCRVLSQTSRFWQHWLYWRTATLEHSGVAK